MKIIHLILIVGFLVVDWFIFHDFFKVGEVYTMVEYLIGILSLLVFWTSGRVLMRG